jgi:hypothetical protein
MFCLIGPNASGRERSMLFQTFKCLLERRAEPCSCGRGTITPAAGICGNHVHVGSVIPQIMSFWQQVLAGNPFNPQNPNPNFVGTSLSQGLGVPDPALFAPNYQPLRSVEINFGIQRELRHGMVFSADYLAKH